MKKYMYIDSGVYEIHEPEFFDSKQEAIYYMVNDFCIVKNIPSDMVPDVVDEATLEEAMSILNENEYFDEENSIDMESLNWHGTTLSGDIWQGQIFEIDF